MRADRRIVLALIFVAVVMACVLFVFNRVPAP